MTPNSPPSASLTALLFCCLSILIPVATALQITPGSPCAEFCLDSGDSRSNPPYTRGEEIVCANDDFIRDSKGQRYRSCLTCLQESKYKKGKENDQDWYLYNLRFAFDYCVFAYPFSKDVGNNPCITSEACGPLESALTGGIKNPDGRQQYDYCDVDDKAMLGDAYEKCYSCVRSDSTHAYISNFLVALAAGCQQRPAPGSLVTLNDTVFVATSVEALSPLDNAGQEDGPALPNTAIAGIAVGGVALILIIAGLGYMQYRKRKNRAARQARGSALSFRCQTHVTPREGDFSHDDPDDDAPSMQEKPYVDPAAALSSNPPGAARWSNMSSTRTNPKVPAITTSLPCPHPTHSSPRALGHDDYVTPTSTTSVRSNAPLIPYKPYNPADHGQISGPLPSPGFGIAASRASSNPYASYHNTPNSAHGIQDDVQWDLQQTSGTRDLLRKKGSWGSPAPVETRTFQMTFDPPPKRGR